MHEECHHAAAIVDAFTRCPSPMCQSVIEHFHGAFCGPNRYLSYLDRDDIGERALTAAYGPNVRRLQSIKAEYDPENVFHLNVNIPAKA